MTPPRHKLFVCPGLSEFMWSCVVFLFQLVDGPVLSFYFRWLVGVDGPVLTHLLIHLEFYSCPCSYKKFIKKFIKTSQTSQISHTRNQRKNNDPILGLMLRTDGEVNR